MKEYDLRWAYQLLKTARFDAKRRAHEPPNITIEDLVFIRSISTHCAGCGKSLGDKVLLHHNHETGDVIGFVHPLCNAVEGQLASLSREARARLIRNFFPDMCYDAKIVDHERI
jgi:hypothetical protein